MLQFLLVLNYDMRMDIHSFQKMFAAGNTSVIYPCIYWCLTRLAQLKQRAYLARFLAQPNIPDEFLADAAIVGLFQKYRELQQEFKTTHKKLGGATADSTSDQNAELKRSIEELQHEKEQLSTKLEKRRAKIQAQPDYEMENFAEMRAAVQAMRKEQSEDTKLEQTIQEQKQALVRKTQEQNRANIKFEQLRASEVAQKDPNKMLKALRREVVEMRSTCNEKLEKVLRDRERQAREVEKVLTAAPMTEEEVQDVARANAALADDCRMLTQQRDAQQGGADASIVFYRKRVEVAEKDSKQSRAEFR
jgi:hypothetical protein